MKAICKKYESLELNELYAILQLRTEVFVVEQNCVYQDMDDKDQLAYHVMIFNEKKLVATSRLLAEGISYDNYSSIGRICSSPLHRRQGLGLQIVKESILFNEELFPEYSIKISAQTYLKKFYTSFGFEAIGEDYLEDDIPHIAMIRKKK
ncbi:MAG: GNAT family N-acetyltransferase [Saprospiraceae bacterium]